ncbi:MAG: UDP-N-acetylglucosamine 2-epimerase (non-hydrolyzing) [Solirubrobacterales bacterium]|nr:UDP-N-acetylglucosamine 2-epimerase (non-hydrolyzing) [Solirubrobacterales bacterium]MBV9534818.1 UDP-N-acetylglucosamine 2-epimerase (non-hydrolyzing) [Solirubrobacterales bacterium]
MKVLTVIGNRPQFIKAAAVTPELRRAHEEVMVHTGQHFDEELSAVFFNELGLPAPDRELGVSLGSNASQTARMLAALEPVINEIAPDVVVVYGDTNSTLAGALAGAQAGVPVAHVEAGLRSFDRSMPEELNRVLVDHCSEILLCPSEAAVLNLEREGVPGPIDQVGDVMVDVALKVQPQARDRTDLLDHRGVRRGQYVLATAHRPGNVDEPARLRELAELLLSMPCPVVWSVHPRTRDRLHSNGLLERLTEAKQLILTPPLGYLELAALLCNARAVMTDSGGIQKEAYLAGVPCITLRTITEWGETVERGWNTLVDLDRQAAARALSREPPAERPPLYGDGRAAERVVSALTLRLQ